MPTKKKPYTADTVERALEHHEATKVIRAYHRPQGPTLGKWIVRLNELDDPLELSLPEAYVLCLGLAQAERRWRKDKLPGRPAAEKHTGWPTEVTVTP